LNAVPDDFAERARAPTNRALVRKETAAAFWQACPWPSRRHQHARDKDDRFGSKRFAELRSSVRFDRWWSIRDAAGAGHSGQTNCDEFAMGSSK